MSDLVEKVAGWWDRKALEAELSQASAKLVEQANEIARLRAALRDMAQEDATNARRMRTAIVLARKKLDILRPMWTGPILQADGILEQALTVNNDRAALEKGERT